MVWVALAGGLWVKAEAVTAVRVRGGGEIVVWAGAHAHTVVYGEDEAGRKAAAAAARVLRTGEEPRYVGKAAAEEGGAE